MSEDRRGIALAGGKPTRTPARHVTAARIVYATRLVSHLADRRRLAELVQAIKTYPGRDEVRLTLRTEHEEHTLTLGTWLITDGIEQRLRPILRGWGELAMIPLR